MSDIQHSEARKLLPILYSIVSKHDTPLTYGSAAGALGRDAHDDARMVAQVCDLLDAAAMLAGVPLIALIAVRQADGSINKKAWRQVPATKEKMVQQSMAHQFTDADIEAVEAALDRLKGMSNKAAWKYVTSMKLPTVASLLATPPTPRVGQQNPAWSRDELIVALDFYFKYNGNPPGKKSQEIQDLSLFMNRMGARTAPSAVDFRNANGVYMKLMNFRRFDPVYASQGKVGLSKGGKAEEDVWNYFASRRQELKQTADAIRDLVGSTEFVPPKADVMADGEEEAEEGNILSRVHRYRERDRKLVEKKKAQVLIAKGRLSCEVCSFDFGERYGDRGQGYIEAHHIRPLHTLKPGTKTKLEDLALLCANCHRMAHAKRPWLGLDELRKL